MLVERDRVGDHLPDPVQVVDVAAGPQGGVGAARDRRVHVAEGRVQDVALLSGQARQLQRKVISASLAADVLDEL